MVFNLHLNDASQWDKIVLTTKSTLELHIFFRNEDEMIMIALVGKLDKGSDI